MYRYLCVFYHCDAICGCWCECILFVRVLVGVCECAMSMGLCHYLCLDV